MDGIKSNPTGNRNDPIQGLVMQVSVVLGFYLFNKYFLSGGRNPNSKPSLIKHDFSSLTEEDSNKIGSPNLDRIKSSAEKAFTQNFPSISSSILEKDQNITLKEQAEIQFQQLQFANLLKQQCGVEDIDTYVAFLQKMEIKDLDKNVEKTLKVFTALREVLPLYKKLEAYKKIEIEIRKIIPLIIQNEENYLDSIIKFTDEEFRYQLIKDSIDREQILGFTELIKRYQITNVKILTEYAKTVAKVNIFECCEIIHNNNINDPDAVIDIATICAENHWNFPAYLEKFAIDDPVILLDLAMICLKKGSYEELAKNIQKFKVKDKNFLMKIAETIACKSPVGISCYIKNFDFADKNKLTNLAEIAAANKNDNIALYIQDYQITDPKALIKIAELAAEGWGDSTSLCIQKFKIQDENSLIRIAKIAAKVRSSGISQHIKKYGIKNEEALIEIAELAAEADGWSTSYNIQEYGIKNPDALIRIAKKAVKTTTIGVRPVSYYIPKYGINDPQALIEIAEIAAEIDGTCLASYIYIYRIEDKDALIRIAKKTARHKDFTFLLFNTTGLIKDQDVLKEIAEIAAEVDILKLSKDIENYEIKDQDWLIMMAKKAANYKTSKVSSFIQRYGIQDENSLIEIAKIHASQDGANVLEFIKNYRIQDQKELKKIFCIAIQNSPFTSLEVIRSFFDNIGQGLINNEFLSSIVLSYSFRMYHNANKSRLDQIASEFFGYIPGDLPIDLQEMDPNQTLFKMCEKLLKPNQTKLEKVVFENLAKYRGIGARGILLGNFTFNSFSEEYKKAYQTLTQKSSSKELIIPRLLPSILPAKWIANGNIELSNKNIENFRNFLEKSRLILKNREHFLLPALLNASIALDLAKDISNQRKVEILAKISENEENILSSLRLLEYFCSQKKYELLNTCNLEFLYEELSRGFEKSLTDKFSDLGLDSQDLVKNYQKTFGKMRIPYALEIYETCLKDSQESVKNTLKRFIKSVLLDSFYEERYRTDLNPHLKKIKEYDPVFYENWKTVTLESSLVLKKAEEISFSYSQFFMQKLEDKHFDEKSLPILYSYLKLHGKSTADVVPIIEESDDPLAVAQKQCIKLITEGLSREEQTKILLHMLEVLEKRIPDLEFLNDVNGVLKALNKKEMVNLGEKVVLTRDWQDLFLCGSEVLGSCQRVDGSNCLNKALLSYCLDGKHALIAVKNKEGKIVARSILRLLWDESTNKPILFLERFYGDSEACSANKEAILGLAEDCAKQLNCEIFSLWDEKKNGAIRSAVSLGSSCPYEYVDAAGGVKEGSYTVSGTLHC